MPITGSAQFSVQPHSRRCGPFFQRKGTSQSFVPVWKSSSAFLNGRPFCDLGTVSKSQLEEHLSAERKALCIVNTRRQAQELYKELKSEGVYHLSTSMYPSHRRRPGGNKNASGRWKKVSCCFHKSGGGRSGSGF